MLTFAEAKPIQYSDQAKWLAIHGANCYGNGVNLARLEYRDAWVKDNEPRILQTAKDPFADLWWTAADSPWMFLAFCFEWAGFIEHGYGYRSSLPVAMDGKNNGLQHYAMLTRDTQLAKATSCVPSDLPTDIYSDIAELVTRKLKWVVERRPDPDRALLADKLLALFDGQIPRRICKMPVMALPYGVQLRGISDYLIEWYWQEGRKKKVDGFSSHGYPEMGYLAQTIWSTMIIDGPVAEALNLMSWLRDVAKVAAAEGVHVSWTTPSGFVARQDYTDSTSRVVKTALGDTIRRHRINTPTDRIDVRASVTALPANFIHSLDAAALTLTLNACLDTKPAYGGGWSFSVVHDSYATHAADAQELSYRLRLAHIQMYSSGVLENFHNEVLTSLSPSATLSELPSDGRWDVTQLQNARYFFS